MQDTLGYITQVTFTILLQYVGNYYIEEMRVSPFPQVLSFFSAKAPSVFGGPSPSSQLPPSSLVTLLFSSPSSPADPPHELATPEGRGETGED